MTLPDTSHLLIAAAGPVQPGDAALPALPHLAALLRRLAPAGRIDADEDTAATPLETALARARGLPDTPGLTPWAAFDTATTGTACAWLRPCHWQLGMGDAQLTDPAALALTDAESHALHAACAPLLAEDGIALDYHAPGAWLARGAVFDGMHAPSLASASGRSITPTQLARAATPEHQRHWQRLQNELQMLLYTHPVNDARDTRRQPPVNALWAEGAGRLDHLPAPTPQVRVDARLSALDPTDAAARAATWQAIDADALAPLHAALNAGADVRLTLCGPRAALTWGAAAGSPWQRLARLWQRQPLADVLAAL
ncbi:MAG: phosphoglycerate mutase [Pseudomonadota bacterium]|nr:phosphoglycerate mutase [Pseudomonadota bacterium]